MANSVLHPALRRALSLAPPTRDLPDFLDDRLGFLEARAARPGPPPKLRLGWPTYLLRDAADVEHVLIANHGAYDKTRRLTGRRGRRLVGDALLTRRGETHRRRRHVLQPLFHRNAIAEVVAPAAESARAEIAGWPPAAPFDASARIHALVLRTRLQTVFSDAGDEELAGLAAAVVARQRFLLHVFASLQPLPNVFPPRLARDYRSALRTLGAAIDARAAAPAGTDLISMLRRARDGGRPLSRRELLDEVVTIGLTGYETPAALLTWLLHAVASNPDVQRRAREELAWGAPTVDDLDRFPYMRAVVAETLRLFPPTWILPRVATRADRLPSGLEVRRHTKLYLSPWILHRDPRYHPYPERFSPDRFGPDWRKTIRRGSYFPFGAGPHVCIGERIATAEVMLMLAEILRRWVVEPAGDAIPVPEPGQTLKPRHPLMLRLHALAPVAA
jgi:cytochrome P450